MTTTRSQPRDTITRSRAFSATTWHDIMLAYYTACHTHRHAGVLVCFTTIFVALALAYFFSDLFTFICWCWPKKSIKNK